MCKIVGEFAFLFFFFEVIVESSMGFEGPISGKSPEEKRFYF